MAAYAVMAAPVMIAHAAIQAAVQIPSFPEDDSKGQKPFSVVGVT